MRRIIILGTAVAVLAGASVAFAATGLNTYTAGFAFKPTKAGSKHKPVSVSFTEIYTRPAPLRATTRRRSSTSRRGSTAS